MIDEIGIHNDMDKPVRMGYVVTAKRVGHYMEVVDYMAQAAYDRYVKKHRTPPTTDQIDALRTELVRLTVIARDIPAAQNLDIAG